MRTTALSNIVALAATIGIPMLVTDNFIADLAIGSHYSYADYGMLCQCVNRIPLSEKSFLSKVQEHAQLELTEIY